MKKKVLIILGPTASGKSDLAVTLARKFNGEIISADSRQVYKGLNIGSGKITKQEMQGIPHHLLDVVDPKKQFSASDYKNLASEIVRYIALKGNLPIVVGGTGFYIDTLTGAIKLPNVPPNKLLRKKLEKLDAEKLYQILKKKDPERAKTIDKYNKIRLVRALEIIDALGSVPKFGSSTSKKYDFVYVGLVPENIEERIKTRLLKRVTGIIKEAKKLHTQGLTYKRMEELGLEYRYVARFLQGKINRNKFIEMLNTEILKYSKRQMTWFKRNKKIKWFSLKQTKQIEEFIKTRI